MNIADWAWPTATAWSPLAVAALIALVAVLGGLLTVAAALRR